jgi:hypothetical protein
LLTQLGTLLLFLPAEAATIQVALHGLSSARVGFAATYRVCAYSTAMSVLSIVPWIGSPIATVGWMPLLVLGLRETHGISTRRAILVSAMGWLRLLFVTVIGTIGASALLNWR